MRRSLVFRSPSTRWILLGLLVFGAMLRGLTLADKPLWLDEVLTVLFSNGQTFADFPRDRWLNWLDLPSLFTSKPLSCRDLAVSISQDSTHPPLFFCGMHQWLAWWQPNLIQLNLVARIPAAGLGVVLIAIAYGIGVQLGSVYLGWLSAALMTVSPLAVYLSQEARHYTLPMLWISLGSWLVLQLQGHFHATSPRDDQPTPHTAPSNPPPATHHHAIWLGLAAWSGVSLLGLYTHYFVLLAIAPQALFLLILAGWYRQRWQTWLGLAIAGLTVGLGYLPWLPILLEHTGRSETDWLSFAPETWVDWFTPIGQQLIGWLVMIIALPVEHQPFLIQIGSGLLMVSLGGWAIWRCIQGNWRYLQMRYPASPHATLSPRSPRSSPALKAPIVNSRSTDSRSINPRSANPRATNPCAPPQPQAPSLATLDRARWLTLAGMVGLIWLEFAAIVYGLGRDLTLAPRYSFVYYSLVVNLIAVGLAMPLAPRPDPAASPQSPDATISTATPSLLPAHRLQPIAATRHLIATLRQWRLPRSSPRAIALVLGIGLISSYCVISDLAFQKPFLPDTIATTIADSSDQPITLVVGYNSMQEIGMGLSVALPLWQKFGHASSPVPPTTSPPASHRGTTSQLLFLERGHNFTDIWGRLATIAPPPHAITALWVIGSQGMRSRHYPPELQVATQTRCQRIDSQYGFTGYSYQGYRCIALQ